MLKGLFVGKHSLKLVGSFIDIIVGDQDPLVVAQSLIGLDGGDHDSPYLESRALGYMIKMWHEYEMSGDDKTSLENAKKELGEKRKVDLDALVVKAIMDAESDQERIKIAADPDAIKRPVMERIAELENTIHELEHGRAIAALSAYDSAIRDGHLGTATPGNNLEKLDVGVYHVVMPYSHEYWVDYTGKATWTIYANDKHGDLKPVATHSQVLAKAKSQDENAKEEDIVLTSPTAVRKACKALYAGYRGWDGVDAIASGMIHNWRSFSAGNHNAKNWILVAGKDDAGYKSCRTSMRKGKAPSDPQEQIED